MIKYLCLKIADMLVAHMPNARKVIAHDAGHHPSTAHSYEFDGAMLKFLATNSA